MKQTVWYGTSILTYWIMQHRFDVTSPTTSPVFPVNLCILLLLEDCSLLLSGVIIISDGAFELIGDVGRLLISGLLFLICALCFLRSANVPAFIVTVTVTFILPLVSVV